MRVFEATRKASLEDVSWLRKAMARRLNELRLSPSIVDDLQLVLSEIAVNAVVHGEPSPKSLGVAVDIDGTRLALEITDDGGPFALFDEVRDGACDDVEALSGRGLAIVHDALDKYSYFGDGVNRFVGWKSLRAPRPTIMIVEDAPVLLQIYSSYLRRDYRIIACDSLRDAREILRNSQVDLVLADFYLGDGLGASLAGAGASASKSPPPIVLISADQSPETRESAMRQGAEFFVTKPVRRVALRETVALALNRSTLRGARLAQSFAQEVDGLVAPRLPATMGGYRAAVVCDTAETGGGDLILHFSMGEAQRVVLVDVMGHGIAAKAWSIAYAAIIRTLQQCFPTIDASAFMTRLADFAWNDQTLEKAIATVLVVDLRPDGVTMATAGHPAPMVVGADLSRVAVDGPLLGILPPQRYEAAQAFLRPGERLVMFTDGVDPYESAGGGAPAWLQFEILAARRKALDDIAESLRVATESQLGPQPVDDWLIAIIEKT